VPVFGRKANALVKAAKRIQDSLGVHQDTVVARQRLREFGVQAHLSGENGFTFGRLHALEERQATLAEEAFEDAWAQRPWKDPRRWLRK
jgi:CHAD domain-containing protein